MTDIFQPMTKRLASGNLKAGVNRRPVSRRAVLLALAGSLAPIGLPLHETRPMDEVIVFDGWILRIDDLEGMPTRVG